MHQTPLQCAKYAWQERNRAVTGDFAQALKSSTANMHHGEGNLTQSQVEKMIDDRVYAIEAKLEAQLNNFMNQIQEQMGRMQGQNLNALQSSLESGK